MKLPDYSLIGTLGRVIIAAVLGLLLTVVLLLWQGCALPQWRVFQKKVPAALVDKPAAQLEGERQGAALIRDLTAPPTVDLVHTVQQVHEIAVDLSSSLGQPAKPVRLEDQAAVIAALRTGLQARDRQLEQWKAFGRKYAGTPLEGTGINLAGPAGLLGLAGVVGLCIACPAVGYIILRVLPILWGFFRTTTSAIGGFVAEHPEAGTELKARLSRRMDRAHKRLVKFRAAPPALARPAPSS